MKDENRMLDLSRRQYRRKRRIRNQVISYISLLVIMVGLVGVGFLGNNYVAKKAMEKNTIPAENIVEDVVEPPVVSEPEIVEEVDEQEQMLMELVDSYLSQMTLEEKVAGLFMVTPESITGVDKAVIAGKGTQEALNTYAVGGIIYFSKNIQSVDQFKKMVTNTKDFSKYPIFLGIDEEGGSVSRIANSSISVTKVAEPVEIGATQDDNEAYEAYSTIGSYLKEYNLNVDFAPVADIATTNNEMFKKRAFGSDATLVSTMIVASMNGLHEQGINACLKHFPGHGSTEGDSHEGISITNRTIDEMRSNEFLPFTAGISAGANFVMVGQISAPNVIGDNSPASLSYTMITDVLRNELGFQGIVITDSMSMAAITDYYTSKEASIKAINAGADMILMPENFKEAYQGLLDAVKDGTITEERINESIRRIYRVKCESEMVLTIEPIE